MKQSFIIPNADKVKLGNQIMAVLRPGRQNAITGKSIAFRLNEPDDRRIRVVIRDLIAQGIPIASSVTEPMGFYIVVNEDEAAEYLRVLDNRIREDKARRDDFAHACAVKGFRLPFQETLL